jgi:hypothetical protein
MYLTEANVYTALFDSGLQTNPNEFTPLTGLFIDERSGALVEVTPWGDYGVVVKVTQEGKDPYQGKGFVGYQAVKELPEGWQSVTAWITYWWVNCIVGDALSASRDDEE